MMDLARFLRTAGDHPVLASDEERELCRRIREDGDEAARERLILHNVRLVVGMARGFQNRGAEMEDLIQVGLMGVHRATKTFDERRGFRFSTYATQWAHQHMQRLCQKTETIHLPDQVAKIRLTAANNPDMSEAELAVRHKRSIVAVRRSLKAAHVGESLDAVRQGDGDSIPVRERVRDEAPTPDERIEGGWLSNGELTDVIDALPETEREVVRLHFLEGLSDREIAEQLEIPRGEVAAHRRRALVALRASLT